MGLSIRCYTVLGFQVQESDIFREVKSEVAFCDQGCPQSSPDELFCPRHGSRFRHTVTKTPTEGLVAFAGGALRGGEVIDIVDSLTMTHGDTFFPKEDSGLYVIGKLLGKVSHYQPESVQDLDCLEKCVLAAQDLRSQMDLTPIPLQIHTWVVYR